MWPYVSRLKVFFLDWLGSAYAGGNLPPVRMMRDVVRGLGGTEEATVISDGSRSNCLFAALVNGAYSHVVEMDDLHRESIFHPACVVMPAAFAMAERKHASGRDLIVAISAGYEVGIRIALAVGPRHYHYWHTTSTCGVFGAAAGAAKLLGLNEDQIAWTLGSAGTQAAGLWEFLVESAMSKQLHPGKAALNGLLAAPPREGRFYRGEAHPGRGEGVLPRHLPGFRRAKMLRRSGEGFPRGPQFH